MRMSVISFLTLSVVFLSREIFSNADLIKWSRRKHSPFLTSLTIKSANLSTWPEALEEIQKIHVTLKRYKLQSTNIRLF